MRIHQILPRSHANGPGPRFVLWLQGCTLKCPGCFNPQTHPPEHGTIYSPTDLLHQISKAGSTIEGVTITGGEPLLQLPEVTLLVNQVKETTNLSIILFTGYTWDEIQIIPGINSLLPVVDVLIAGRYQKTKRLAVGLVGSSNKTVHYLTTRYTPADLVRVPPAEVIVTPQGELIFSGIDPLRA